MADANLNQTEYIDKMIAYTAKYRAVVDEGRALYEEWEAGRSGDITEEDFDGVRRRVIPLNDSRKSALTEAVGNVNSIVTTYDNGIDTNFNRIS